MATYWDDFICSFLMCHWSTTRSRLIELSSSIDLLRLNSVAKEALHEATHCAGLMRQ
jgi:hypothetical protein